MNISLCIAWFVFGFIVGQILLIGIALAMHEKEDKQDGKRISEQSNNHINQDKQ